MPFGTYCGAGQPVPLEFIEFDNGRADKPLQSEFVDNNKVPFSLSRAYTTNPQAPVTVNQQLDDIISDVIVGNQGGDIHTDNKSTNTRTTLNENGTTSQAPIPSKPKKK